MSGRSSCRQLRGLIQCRYSRDNELERIFEMQWGVCPSAQGQESSFHVEMPLLRCTHTEGREGGGRRNAGGRGREGGSICKMGVDVVRGRPTDRSGSIANELFVPPPSLLQDPFLCPPLKRPSTCPFQVGLKGLSYVTRGHGICEHEASDIGTERGECWS